MNHRCNAGTIVVAALVILPLPGIAAAPPGMLWDPGVELPRVAELPLRTGADFHVIKPRRRTCR